MKAKDSDVLSVLIASGFFGLRGFWKVSSVSKKVLKLRDDPSRLGFGSVCSGFCSTSEREGVWKMIDHCFEQDDAKALQQVLALKGLSGRYPKLLRRVLEKKPGSLKCVKFLMDRESTPFCVELSLDILSKMTAEHLKYMIFQKRMHPDCWLDVPNGHSSEPPSTLSPALNVVIQADRFDLAEVLLDAGARVDVCTWSAEEGGVFDHNFRPPTFCGSSPLLLLVDRLALLHTTEQEFLVRGTGEGEEGHRHVVQQRETGLALLERMARMSKELGCLELRWSDRRTFFDERTPLGRACVCRDAEAVGVLLKVQERVVGQKGKENIILLPLSDEYISIPRRRQTEILRIEDSSCAAALEVILADLQGVHLDRVDEDGHTALSLACSLGMEKSAEVLLKKGARPSRVMGLDGDFVSRSPLVEAVRDLDGGDLQFFSLKCNSDSLVSLLLQWKANPNEVVEDLGEVFTLLQWVLGAAGYLGGQESDPVSVAKLLLHNGASCSPPSPSPFPSPTPILPAATRPKWNPPSVSQVSPLLLACDQYDDPELLRLLCTKGGADPNASGLGLERKRWLESPVRVVMEKGRMRSLEALADCGADLNVVWEDGHSPLSLACSQSDAEKVQLLLDRGVALMGEVEGGRLQIPLVIAADRLCTEIMSILLERGADVNRQGLLWSAWDGRETLKSPLQAAMDLGGGVWRDADFMGTLFRVVEMLIEHGACCSRPSNASAETESESQPSNGVLLSPYPPACELSPLSAACEMQSVYLLALLYEKGGAALESQAEVGRVLAFLLSHRGDAQSMGQEVSQEEAKTQTLFQWRLAEDILQKEGAETGLLSVYWRGTVTATVDNVIPSFGSGSWISDLIALEEARGPSLLRVIREVPLGELEEPQLDPRRGQSLCYLYPEHRRTGEFCPLLVAIRSGWEEGIEALMERGVGVSRRNDLGDYTTDERSVRLFTPETPLFAALDTERCELALRLIKKGGVIKVEEKERLLKRVQGQTGSSQHPTLFLNDLIYFIKNTVPSDVADH
uniref:Uncharacterized protein n=1 Tax=Chromera velia CCMP2878 TaxID=1169474 RepID=A0A0G4FC86_9ALVE|eukprot:Cvel_3198.t1-p1 / transcript=Cvel_3198.t1 / gene=Cvel_3198 / organism=Chromera_velia_CCMP2878 / gene_product=hypothetical protein / transcript_product=hypothetical protein / location=Cvel_scaffold124:127488-131032(+) / protein_length=1022 / sequence_SO=supercontig / SO=protein_coding / is_pseudo=false